MTSGLDDLIAPDMQAILLCVVPALFALASLTMNLSRGFSTAGTVFMTVCVLLSLYFLPGLLEIF